MNGIRPWRPICGLRARRDHGMASPMKVVTTGGELQQVLSGVAGLAGRRVLVPTMGALHRGHLELVKCARAAAGPAGTVVVSIFVNPIQFDRADDLHAYPRPLESDLAQCRDVGVDVVFAPDAGAMYHPDRSVMVSESLLSRGLCGAARPGHFDGVCTVVLKLFLLSACHAAVFGEKDFQQLAIIRRMVRDLDVPVDILECPTVREPDGLALSSRNTRLTPAQRADAPRIHRALTAAAELAGVLAILAAARAEIAASPLARIDYLELVDAETLQPVTALTRPAILAAAVYYGDVRLIDHVAVGLC
jgi:pantoate--beta-alanine ligase